MRKQKRNDNISLFVFLILWVSLCLNFSRTLFAEPVGGFAIDEESKSCAMFILGDECSKCELPLGWKKVEQCPSGYNNVGRMTPGACKPLKDSFCCTVNHSGGNGDCDDVVVNDTEKKCAFVEDIALCLSLPSGWKRPEMIEFWGKLCPSLDHQWMEGDLQCEQ